MTRLATHRFQADFARALLAQAPRDSSPWLQQEAFAVYRNTVMKACIDALEANYPSVARLVGRDWFRSAAATYAVAHPPQDGSLFDYGESFARFLQDFEPAATLLYLPEVARLDRFWTEAHTAADALPLRAAHLAQLSPDALMTCRLVLHPAARWAWFDAQPCYSIWARNRAADPPQDELNWEPEGALVTRPEYAVAWQAASRADCAFLDACAAGHALSEAAERAQQADPVADLMHVIGRLLGAGAIANLNHPQTGEPRP